ncbi:Conserved_hypothetical protein [Hexamita inflata]|uniref:Transmembrane protein n=1 Tax=Hexamita inflata TaxID=28002 RepID=A0AA86TLD6_9EUKA|nr:Conserved hypothetical protein [Hexamita inflata]
MYEKLLEMSIEEAQLQKKQYCLNKCKKTVYILSCFILSPIILVVIIFYFLLNVIVGIISKCSNQKLIQNFKANRKSLFTSRVLERVETEPGQNSMFFFKPCSSDLFISVNSGQIQIIDSNFSNISSKQSQFLFKPGQIERFCTFLNKKNRLTYKVNETAFEIPPSYQSQVFICNSKVYFNVFDFIFVLTDNLELELIDQVPDFGYKSLNGKLKNLEQQYKFDYIGGQLFTIDNKLYMHNNSSKLFQIEGKQLKCVNRKHFSTYYFQFCDKVYAIGKDMIFTVEKNLKLKSLEYSQFQDIIFSQGATLVLSDKLYYNQYYFLNMLDGVITSLKFDQIDLRDIYKVIELGPTGWQLKNEILVKLWGVDFPQRMKDYFNNYQSIMLQNSQYIKNTFRLMLSNRKYNLNKLFCKQFTNIADQFAIIQNQIIEQQKNIVQSVYRVINLQNQLLSGQSNMCYDMQ